MASPQDDVVGVNWCPKRNKWRARCGNWSKRFQERSDAIAAREEQKALWDDANKQRITVIGGVASIDITRRNGETATVHFDSADVPLIAKYKWSLSSHAHTTYAETWSVEHQKIIRMHRLLLDPDMTSQKVVDHLSGDGLDNRRINLRLVTHQDNVRNQTRLRRRNKSGATGVFWSSKSRRWVAQVGGAGGARHLGSFAKKEDAIDAANRARAGWRPHANLPGDQQP